MKNKAIKGMCWGLFIFIGILILVEQIQATKYVYLGKSVPIQELNYSNVKMVVVMDKLYANKYCGYYLMGGVYYLSQQPECSISWVSGHELKHHIYHTMPIQNKTGYCKYRATQYNYLGYDWTCWEDYAYS
jgi:hypothetical protein